MPKETMHLTIKPWYQLTLYVYMAYIFIISFYMTLYNFRIASLIHGLLVISIMVLILVEFKHIVFSIRLWILLTLISSSIYFIRLVLKIITGSFDKIQLPLKVEFLIAFAVGVVLIYYAKKSISFISSETSNADSYTLPDLPNHDK